MNLMNMDQLRASYKATNKASCAAAFDATWNAIVRAIHRTGEQSTGTAVFVTSHKERHDV